VRPVFRTIDRRNDGTHAALDGLVCTFAAAVVVGD